MDDGRVRTQVSQPGIWVSLLALRAGNAHVADVNAGPDRHVTLFSGGQEVGDHGHRRGLAGRGKVFDDECFQPRLRSDGREPGEARLEFRPPLCVCNGIVPIVHGERAHVPACDLGADGGSKADRSGVPGTGGGPRLDIRRQEQIRRVSRQSGEGRGDVQAEIVGGPREVLRLAIDLGGIARQVHQVERVLHQAKAEAV